MSKQLPKKLKKCIFRKGRKLKKQDIVSDELTSESERSQIERSSPEASATRTEIVRKDFKSGKEPRDPVTQVLPKDDKASKEPTGPVIKMDSHPKVRGELRKASLPNKRKTPLPIPRLTLMTWGGGPNHSSRSGSPPPQFATLGGLSRKKNRPPETINDQAATITEQLEPLIGILKSIESEVKSLREDVSAIQKKLEAPSPETNR